MTEITFGKRCMILRKKYILYREEINVENKVFYGFPLNLHIFFNDNNGKILYNYHGKNWNIF